MTHLPIPNTTALQHSQELMALIREEIAASSGALSFARFMELALYAPGLGYYSAGSHKLGKGGDFVTAPEMSPLFAKCLARQCAQVLTALNGGDILELGAGTGKLAGDLLSELECQNSLPNKYYILEISAELRARQQQYLSENFPQFQSRVEWLDTLPIQGVRGVIIANEVLDAMPVHLFRWDDNAVYERCVGIVDDQLSWKVIAPTTHELTKRVAALQESCLFENGYESEINLMLSAWIKAFADALQRGVLLFLDYGYGRQEYYHPDRLQGTLMCFYQHHKHDDPFQLLGLQDITAHVDFTAVAESAVDAGLRVAGFTTQASFLLACGLLDLAADTKLSPAEDYQQNQVIKTLTLPSQMGEIIKAVGLTKNFDAPLLGFGLHDRRKDL